MFLNDNQYFCVYLSCANWDIYAPPLQIITQKKIKFFYFLFFHFRCILLQISYKQCFFINISIFGRSGVNIELACIQHDPTTAFD